MTNEHFFINFKKDFEHLSVNLSVSFWSFNSQVFILRSIQENNYSLFLAIANMSNKLYLIYQLHSRIRISYSNSSLISFHNSISRYYVITITYTTSSFFNVLVLYHILVLSSSVSGLNNVITCHCISYGIWSLSFYTVPKVLDLEPINLRLRIYKSFDKMSLAVFGISYIFIV